MDFININVIKASIDLLASPLSQICDISFSTGIVPDRLKISKVIPIFKSEDNTKFPNYRPISISPCCPKIRESAIYHHLMNYLVTIYQMIISMVLERNILLSWLHWNLLTKYLNHLKRMNSLWVFSLMSKRPLTLLIIPSS